MMSDDEELKRIIVTYKGKRLEGTVLEDSTRFEVERNGEWYPKCIEDGCPYPGTYPKRRCRDCAIDHLAKEPK